MNDWLMHYHSHWPQLVCQSRVLVGEADAEDTVQEAAMLAIERERGGKRFSWHWGLRSAARLVYERRERPTVTGRLTIPVEAELSVLLQASRVVQCIGTQQAASIVDGECGRSLRFSRRLLDGKRRHAFADSPPGCNTPV